MKIYLSTPGDPSVGLPGDEITVEWNWNLEELTSTFPDGREGCRRRLADMFAPMTDGQPVVVFEDECGDCGAIIPAEGDSCPNRLCPSH